ncbi:GNAT family N-acetyltransferase [Bacillus nakamurai]|uniref:GCN5 family acetyltransferase n=1 Tax=Bacillus nakamurai TaxID=1793963 RepID=A0A150F7J9_9BACI|nr:GNAT family N-acetyltransferase [Bacillus nakamurai]KXZ18419.1 GCN5 family acetyltransferase [Bacillus nakamurai]MED1229554.1 GNAT family N-acetyltransferase [Bacillus nakamurai]
MYFQRINLNKHEETAVSFWKDSFIASFGTADGFNREEYLSWLSGQIQRFPDGFVMAYHMQQPIGQLELSIKTYQHKEIGYVHLYYIIPQERGRGYGSKLDAYAQDFFRTYGVTEYHLRVSPSNKGALTFYRKQNMQALGLESDGKVIRMRGEVQQK